MLTCIHEQTDGQRDKGEWERTIEQLLSVDPRTKVNLSGMFALTVNTAHTEHRRGHIQHTHTHTRANRQQTNKFFISIL